MKAATYSFICLLVLCGYSGIAQTMVEGTVKDEKGPLVGANVIVKHTTRGTSTNASRHFSISTSKGDTLNFSFTGYETLEVVVTDRSNYSITLINRAHEMENVVVIGYGSKNRNYLDPIPLQQIQLSQGTLVQNTGW